MYSPKEHGCALQKPLLQIMKKPADCKFNYKLNYFHQHFQNSIFFTKIVVFPVNFY